jgi:beta-glucosidase
MAEDRQLENLKFPKKFLWGAATAAHQVEGNTYNQWDVWELENAKLNATQAQSKFSYLKNWPQIKPFAQNPNNYVAASSVNHYNLYPIDFDLLQTMHMNAFRFSIEWSRIEPKAGVWNATAIGHYKTYLDDLRHRGIEPIVTLFHFTLPVWFAEMGGFEKRSNVKYFVRYARKVMEELGQDIKYIITINEPGVYIKSSYYRRDWPPEAGSLFKAWRVINNLALGNRRAAKEIHKLNNRYKISIAENSVYFYPGDNAWLSRLSTIVFQYLQDDYIIKKFIKSCDFLGVNYYFSDQVYGYRIHNRNHDLSDTGWDMQPNNIQYVIERLSKKYKLPIMITENGLADAKDDHRQWWIEQTIIGINRAMQSGAKVIGYLHWSLIDNFEWALGKWPKFGLAAVDYRTGKRQLRPSGKWFGVIIKKLSQN